MAHFNNLRLLFLSCSLLIFIQSAKPELSPANLQPELSPVPSPSQAPLPVSSPFNAPSPSPSDETHTSEISSPPSISPGPSANPPSVSVNPKVEEICSFTDYPSLCVATITPHLEGNYDVPSVLEASINLGARLAEQGLSLTNELIKTQGSELAPILDDCIESYVAALDNFESTKKAFPNRDIGTMNSMLSAVITDVGDCEDGFSGVGTVSPLAKIAENLTNMASNCLAIVAHLE